MLTQREDFEVWRLSGGVAEPGEILAQAAVREAKEETGLDVRLTRLVGSIHDRGRGNSLVRRCCLRCSRQEAVYRPTPARQFRVIAERFLPAAFQVACGG